MWKWKEERGGQKRGWETESRGREMKMKQKELVHYSDKIMMARTSWRRVKNSEKQGVHKRLCSPFKLLMHSLIQLRIYRCLLCDRNWISTCGKECYQYVIERISLNIELPSSTWAQDCLMFTYSSFFCIYKWPMGGSGQWNMNIKWCVPLAGYAWKLRALLPSPSPCWLRGRCRDWDWKQWLSKYVLRLADGKSFQVLWSRKKRVTKGFYRRKGVTEEGGGNVWVEFTD